MQTVITMSPDELAEVLSAVCQANGYNVVGEVTLRGADGAPVDIDRVEVTCQLSDFKVRCTPERAGGNLSEQYRQTILQQRLDLSGILSGRIPGTNGD